MAAISAGVQFLEVARDPHQAERARAIIKRQTNHLCHLVDDLMELTRISQNQIILKKRSTDLKEIVQGAIEDIQSEYDKKGIKIETDIQMKPVTIMADPVRITQVLANVLFNALKFTEENGEVLVTLITIKDHAVITIKDSGIGMSADVLPDLFKPFFQVDHSLNRGNDCGLGLGLSIVKDIVELHEGKISGFSDGLGKGSTFTISLPIQVED